MSNIAFSSVQLISVYSEEIYCITFLAQLALMSLGFKFILTLNLTLKFDLDRNGFRYAARTLHGPHFGEK